MCMFCAAIPMTAAVGIKLNANQKSAHQQAEKENRQPPAEKLIARATVGLIVLLTFGSLFYHTVLSPLWKI